MKKILKAPPLPTPGDITCPICEARNRKSEYITEYTKTISGRLIKHMICPVCHITRAFIVEKEGE